MLPCTVLSSSCTVSTCSAVAVKRATHLVFARSFEEHFYPMSVAASDCVRASSSKAKNIVTGMLQCLVRFAPFVERRTFSRMGCQARRSHCAPAFWFGWWYELEMRARNLFLRLDTNPLIPPLCSRNFLSFQSPIFTLDSLKYIIYLPIQMTTEAKDETASQRAALSRVHSPHCHCRSLFILDSLKLNVFIITTLIH